MATFDQRNQKVNNQFNVSGNVNFSHVQNQIDLISQLQQLQEEVTKTIRNGGLNEEIAIDLEAKVKKAVSQAKQPEPNKKSIIEYLIEAQELIKGIAAASGLVKALAEAAEVVGRIL